MDRRNSGVHAVSTDHQLDSLISSGVRMVVNCWAPWAAPCKQMNVVFETLQEQSSKRYAGAAVDEHVPLLFCSMEAEKMPSMMKRYNIATVPTFLFFAGRRVVRRSSGADATLLCNNVRWLTESLDATLLEAACDVVSTLDEVTLVMKGTVDEPKCGFSRQAVQTLRSAGVQFATFNVLEDEDVRRVMKERFDWPTFPMVFARGKLIGGIDIVREMADEGTLVEQLLSDEADDERVEGADGAAQGESDEKTRAREGEAGAEKTAVSGGDAQLSGNGHAAAAAAAAGRGGEEEEEEEVDGVSVALRERLAALVNRSEVMLFMKGSPGAPRCGFSRKMVEILREQAVQYEHFDILTDNEVRQGLKKVWQWPTFPQLYSRGKLIGGLDIVKELVDSGELKKELTA